MLGSKPKLDDFLSLSATLTGATRFRLHGTGQAELYFQTVSDVVGDGTLADLLKAWTAVETAAGDDAATLDRGLRREVLGHEKFGPIARNIIKLWYVGVWYALPVEWREAFGVLEKDVTFVPSPAAYTEGLLWPTIGANPAGAKGPGYGSWVSPPRILLKT